ncbi:unnamed protein product [Colias eurytheme]|nr:unnamed protein product [Colias eurytheme]
MWLAMNIAALTLTLHVINADVNFSGIERTDYKRLQQKNACPTYTTHDKVLLKRVTMISKYIFTGKVHSVHSGNNTRVYKVKIRRVLKGDLNEINVPSRFGKAASLRFSDATVLVQSTLDLKCPPLRVRTYVIFLTVKKNCDEEGPVRLKLVLEPVLLTLRNIDIIEAAIKELGKELRKASESFSSS